MPNRDLKIPGYRDPLGFSRAIETTGRRTVYTAGQAPVDASGTLVGEGDVTAQAEAVFEKVKAVVEASGGSLSDVAKITVYLTDISSLAAVRDIWMRIFKQPYPAMTVAEVTALAEPGFLIEAEAIAVMDEQSEVKR